MLRNPCAALMRALICVGALLISTAWAADASDAFTGKWNVTVTYGADTGSAVLELTEKDGKIEGSSGPLDVGGYMQLTYVGTLKGTRLTLAATGWGSATVGALDVGIKNKQLVGKGMLFGGPVTVLGVRPDNSAREPKTYDFVPKSYITTLSSRHEPVLHIYPGDSVKTTTIDASGQDGALQFVGMPGNPHTGPFFIEGAMPGDTLVVHLTRVRVNSKRAEMVCSELNANALPGWAQPKDKDKCDWNWTLDAENNIGKPTTPSTKLKNFKVPLRPMVGSIGVAPPSNQAITASDLGLHGGNLDYNRIVEGVTLHFPVFRAGALFSLGDGHAAQGDGEITGQGLEVPLAVEFKVDLIKGKRMLFPWAEDAEYFMFTGIGNSIDNAQQAATAGISDWLKDRYGLDQSDIATVLGTSIEYDIAEIVDPRPHVVAKLRKDILAQISEP